MLMFLSPCLDVPADLAGMDFEMVGNGAPSAIAQREREHSPVDCAIGG